MSDWASPGGSSIPTGTATGSDGALAIGASDPQATGNWGVIALGPYALATADYTVAVGGYSEAAATNATALGNAASATGLYATALGVSTGAEADEATAIGGRAGADTAGGTAVGFEASVGTDGGNSTVVGHKASSRAGSGIAIGAQTTLGPFTDDLFTIGTNTTMDAAREGCMSVGNFSGISGGFDDARPTYCTAIGSNAFVTGETPAGDSFDDGYGSVIVGANGAVTGAYSVALGGDASTGNRGTALGGAAYAAPKGVAVGENAYANAEGSVAIGSDASIGTQDVGRVNVDGFIQGVTDGAVPDSELNNGEMTADYDETAGELVFRVKDSTGSVVSGSVSLS